MNQITTSKDWLEFVSRNQPTKVDDGIKVGIKGAKPRIEYWTAKQAEDNGLTIVSKHQSIYLISGFENGEESLISVPMNIWKIYDELANFYSIPGIPENIINFVDNYLDVCEDVHATLTESQNILFSKKKLGDHVNYNETISDLTECLKTLSDTEPVLMLTNNILENDSDMNESQKKVRDILVVQAIYLAQSKVSFENLLALATKLQSMADAKKTYGILSYRKDLKDEKNTREEQAKVGKLLTHYRDLYNEMKKSI